MDSIGLVVFLHLPKTGGTTLRQIVRSQLPAGSVMDLNEPADIHTFLRDWPENRSRVRAIQGHIAFGMHQVLDVPCRYVTLLRDPVERVVSQYYFLRRNTAHPHHEAAARMSLSEFALSDLDPGLDNMQCRMLSTWSADPPKVCDEAVLQTAKNNLHSAEFAVVGVTNRFDESLVLLQAALGWSTPRYTASNVTVGRPKLAELAADVIAAIDHRNRFDRELFQLASQLFDEQVAQLGESFPVLLQQLRRANRWTSVRGAMHSARGRLRARWD